VPPDVKIGINGNEVTVTGPKGELKQSYSPNIKVELAENKILVTRSSDERSIRALHGLVRSLLANMVLGVTKGFHKDLELVGVGYRVQIVGSKLVMRAGYSHQIEVEPLLGTTFTVDGTTKIKVNGIDKERVGQMAANIRGIKPIDSFKGKGIKYAGEKVHLKAGKTGKAIGGGKA